LPEKVFYKEIPSDPSYLPEAEEFIINIAQASNLAEVKYNSLALSFSEAASNCVVHGNKNDPNKKVRIKVIVDEEKITVILKDEGNGFNIQKVPDPTKPENILKDSGRGIHIMKSFLDELSYRSTPEGTETILVIKLK